VIEASAGELALVGGAFLAAALAALILTPAVSRGLAAQGVLDHPGADRHVHARPIPRGGGLAVAVAFVLVGTGVLLIDSATGLVPGLAALSGSELAALLGGVVLAALLGLVDDRWSLRARWQLAFQVLLAVIAIAAAVRIDYVNNPVGQGAIVFAPWFVAAFTTFWIVGMINSINWIDGLDGLSSGVGLIAALTLGVISLTAAIDQPAVTLLCAVLAGALAGFLPWNFHPARVFIGSAGTFVIGYSLAVLSILGTAKVAVALLVLGVPIIDTFWIIIRRLSAGQPPFAADRGHLHHRLLDLGLSHRGAVLTIYAICIVLAVLSLVLSGTGQLYAFLGVVVGGGLFLYLLTRRAREALEPQSYDEGGGDGPV
jgi:UDP-GlcNAc:undecaprenyl-phosphate/decaprenyl-phosphate GlcNAc-1-phosphate transferase